MGKSRILGFGVCRLKIGDRATVIDKDSPFFGLTVVITDKRVEPKPRPHAVYKVITENGLPPKNFPFKSAELTAKQLYAGHYIRKIEHQKRKDFILFTMVKADSIDRENDDYECVQVEKLFNKSKTEIIEYIVKQDLRHLSEIDGALVLYGNPVRYEILELDSQPDCLNEFVMRQYRSELLLREVSIQHHEDETDASGYDVKSATIEEERTSKVIGEMTKLSHSVSDRLKTLAEKKGVSQRVLARELGITPPIMTNYFDHLKIDYGKLLRFAEYLDVSFDCLVGLSDDPPTKEKDDELKNLLKEKQKQIEELEDKIKDLKSAVENILK